MRRLLLLVTLLIAGCASNNVPSERPDPSVDEILAQAADPDVYGVPLRCLNSGQYNRVEVLDRRNLVFWGPGDRIWLNRLRAECLGLRRNAVLRFDLHSSRVCNLDSVTAVERSFWFWRRTSASCSLGQFEPISMEQVAALKTAIQDAR